MGRHRLAAWKPPPRTRRDTVRTVVMLAVAIAGAFTVAALWLAMFLVIIYLES